MHHINLRMILNPWKTGKNFKNLKSSRSDRIAKLKTSRKYFPSTYRQESTNMASLKREYQSLDAAYMAIRSLSKSQNRDVHVTTTSYVDV